jgi:N-acetylmuramoyl-L-alanine amidase
MRIIRRGDEGDEVRDVQRRLIDLGSIIEAGELEGVYGLATEEAVRAFQRDRNLPVDGLVGSDTWGQLVEAGYRLGDRTLYLRSPAFRGDDVRRLQRMLNVLGFDAGKEDGILGRATADAVMEFQRNVAEKVDGIVGLDTVRSLERMRPADDGPGRALVREEEAVRSMDSSLAGSTIAIDAGHGGDDSGNEGPTGSREADLTALLAAALAEALRARGAQPTILLPRAKDSSPTERAHAANAMDAAVCVSVHLAAGDPDARGATCAYWGTGTTHSPAGQRLAELIQGALIGQVGLSDGGIRPLTISLLRETRMPAVQVEPCHLTNEKDEHLLAEEGFRQRVAEAIAEGIARFFGAAAIEGAKRS